MATDKERAALKAGMYCRRRTGSDVRVLEVQNGQVLLAWSHTQTDGVHIHPEPLADFWERFICWVDFDNGSAPIVQ